MSTVLIPIVLAGLYGVVMFQFSAWSLKRQLSRQSNPLIDKNLEKIMAKFANILEVEKIRINIFETDPINGLAAPDGRIFITRGFYKKYQNGDITVEEIEKHELDLLNYATDKINEIEGVQIIGNSKDKASVISFVMEGIHPHDIGTIMDNLGIAIRAGHHCTQPVMDFYDIPATARASFAIYNTKEDVDKLIDGIQKTKEVFA